MERVGDQRWGHVLGSSLMRWLETTRDSCLHAPPFAVILAGAEGSGYPTQVS